MMCGSWGWLELDWRKGVSSLIVRNGNEAGREEPLMERFAVGLTIATVTFLVLVSVSGFQSDAKTDFERMFTGQTLRLDYFHTGTAGQEHLSLDGLRKEGPWPGSRTRLIDDTNLGTYRFEVWDSHGEALIYSRGFDSIYKEWETTSEASDGIWRTFHESQRFPEPVGPVRLVLRKLEKGALTEIFSVTVDPDSRFIDRAPLTEKGTVWSVFKHGEPAAKVDLLVMGDGYTQDEAAKFGVDVTRLVDELFSVEPWRSRKEDFNVWAISVGSEDSGISDPRRGIWKNTPLGLSFNAFDLDRYVLTFRNRELREFAAQAPYDTLMMLFNGRKYGGGGIFNLWATCSSDSSEAPYVFIHELGHSFAGLADEYYTSQVAYEEFVSPGVEPWEPNITALLDPTRLKWRDLVGDDVPIPTPWKKGSYEKLSIEYQEKRAELLAKTNPEDELERLYQDSAGTFSELFGAEDYEGKIGAFEGAGYQAEGLYRPALNCMMFSRKPHVFCKVCQQAIERVIDLHATP